MSTPERIHVRWGKAGDTRVTYMEERFLPPNNGAEYIRADLAAANAKAHEKEIAIWAENYAALERQLAESRAVKPLEWQLNAGAIGPYYSAYCPVFVMLHHATDETECDAIDAARTARILSALKDPTPRFTNWPEEDFDITVGKRKATP